MDAAAAIPLNDGAEAAAATHGHEELEADSEAVPQLLRRCKNLRGIGPLGPSTNPLALNPPLPAGQQRLAARPRAPKLYLPRYAQLQDYYYYY